MEAATPPPDTAPLFRVTGQQHDSRYNPNGDPINQYTINFVTRSGVKSYVTVTDADYNADNVRRLLTEKATEIEAVANLTAAGNS